MLDIYSITPTKCYCLRRYAPILLLVSFYLTPSSGRTYVCLTPKHLSIRSCYLWYSGCLLNQIRFNNTIISHCYVTYNCGHRTDVISILRHKYNASNV